MFYTLVYTLLELTAACWLIGALALLNTKEMQQSRHNRHNRHGRHGANDNARDRAGTEPVATALLGVGHLLRRSGIVDLTGATGSSRGLDNVEAEAARAGHENHCYSNYDGTDYTSEKYTNPTLYSYTGVQTGSKTNLKDLSDFSFDCLYQLISVTYTQLFLNNVY